MIKDIYQRTKRSLLVRVDDYGNNLRQYRRPLAKNNNSVSLTF